MPETDSPPPAAGHRPRRRWLRLSLRGLMALVLALGAGLGYLVNAARVQREAVRAVERAGGSVQRRWTTYPGFGMPGVVDGRPWLIRWLERHVDPDYFDPVIRVDLGDRAGDAEMDQVARLAHLEQFTEHGSNVTDAGLARLGGLGKLRRIDLVSPIAVSIAASGEPIFAREPRSAAPGAPRITGAFLRSLAGLANLKRIGFDGTTVRDAELVGIGGLAGLEELDLADAGVTDAGLVHLRGLTGLTSLVLEGNPGITSAGLAHLRGLGKLVNLDLDRTRVRDLAPLAALPGCSNLKLAGTPIGDADLAPLAGMTHLINLYLPETAITGAGLAALRDLPELRMVVLAETKVDAAGIAALRQLPQLQWLNLAGTAITDAGLDDLRISHLQVLDLTNTAVTDAGIARLLGATPLIGLNLEEARLTPTRLAAFLQVRPTLTFNNYSVR